MDVGNDSLWNFIPKRYGFVRPDDISWYPLNKRKGVWFWS